LVGEVGSRQAHEPGRALAATAQAEGGGERAENPGVLAEKASGTSRCSPVYSCRAERAEASVRGPCSQQSCGGASQARRCTNRRSARCTSDFSMPLPSSRHGADVNKHGSRDTATTIALRIDCMRLADISL